MVCFLVIEEDFVSLLTLRKTRFSGYNQKVCLRYEFFLLLSISPVDARRSFFHWQKNLLTVGGGVVFLVIGYGKIPRVANGGMTLFSSCDGGYG